MDLTARIAQLERLALLLVSALGENRHLATMGKLVSQMPGAALAETRDCRYANGCPHPGFCIDKCSGVLKTAPYEGWTDGFNKFDPL